ncbi:hypothetical protein [Nocardia sp. NPDC059239]|uniref:hypothetical protein n=1 Tax=unclassified Nocardia TaxID=2637762 RepID=UPI00367A02AB
MRLRILPLPANVLGQATQTPFCLIFDRCTEADTNTITAMVDIGLKDSTGARSVLAFQSEIELD